jgi:hypothetical protein
MARLNRNVRVHHMRIRSAFRLALIFAIAYAGIATVLAAHYFLNVRPALPQPEKLQVIEKILRDPSTPADVLRTTALEGNELIVDGQKVIEAAIQFILIIGFGASLVLACVAYLIAKSDGKSKSAP